MKKSVLIILCVSLLIGCQQATKVDDSKAVIFPKDDIKVDSKVFESYDYAGKAYSWGGSDISINDPSGKWVAPDFDFDLVISENIKQELKKHGLQESKKEYDLVVSYGLNINMAAIRSKSFEGIDERLVLNIPEGALTIVIVNRLNDKMVWMGWANADYKKQSADIARERINYAVSAIFNKFPN